MNFNLHNNASQKSIFFRLYLVLMTSFKCQTQILSDTCCYPIFFIVIKKCITIYRTTPYFPQSFALFLFFSEVFHKKCYAYHYKAFDRQKEIIRVFLVSRALANAFIYGIVIKTIKTSTVANGLFISNNKFCYAMYEKKLKFNASCFDMR